MYDKLDFKLGLLKKKSNTVYVNEIILYYLNKDYCKRAEIIYNLSLHIDRLYDYFIITDDDRKKIISIINNTLNQLNKYYYH